MILPVRTRVPERFTISAMDDKLTAEDSSILHRLAEEHKFGILVVGRKGILVEIYDVSLATS